MKSFTLIGVRPAVPKPGISGIFVASTPNGKSSRYVDPRRSQQLLAALQRQGSANPKHLRSVTHPPARPVVRMAKERDNLLFKKLVSLSGIVASMTPKQVSEAIHNVIWYLKEDGASLHRCVPNCVIIRLTLRTQSGYSRFEGTAAQFVQTFRPTARAASA